MGRPSDIFLPFDNLSLGSGVHTVLHLIDTFETGGAETVFCQLVSNHDPRRFRAVPAVLGHGWLSRTLTAAGHEPLILSTAGSLDLSFVRQLRQVVREHRIDLIQTHLLTSAVYGGIVGRLARIPVVSTFHGIMDVNASYMRVKGAIVNRCVDRVVFVSDTLRRGILARAPFAEGRSAVIHNGVDLGRFTPVRDRAWRRALGIADDAILIGGVGRATPVKAFPLLMNAVARLRQGDPRVMLVIVGAEDPDGDRGEHDRLVALRRSLGLESAVRFVGFQTDMPAVMQSLDILAVTSRSEGFSLTTIEAMACGAAVVATRCGGPEEIVTDEVDGLLIPVDDADGLLGALGRLVGGDGLRSRLTDAGHTTARGRFSLSRTVGRYEALYESLLDGSRGRTAHGSSTREALPSS